MPWQSIKITVLAAALAVAVTVEAQSAPKVLTMDLNALKQGDDACEVFLVIENASDLAFATFSADLGFFDKGGVVLSRLTVDIGKLRPNKRHVMSFRVNDLKCDDVGSVLLNEIADCQHSAGADFDCTDAVRVIHHTATFVK